jgi:DNA processing protein
MCPPPPRIPPAADHGTGVAAVPALPLPSAPAPPPCVHAGAPHHAPDRPRTCSAGPHSAASPTADRDDLRALLQLLACPGRRAPLRALLERHGSAAAALAAGPAAWRQAGLDPAQCQALAAPVDATQLASTQCWLDGGDAHHVLGWHDPAYPPRLREAPHPPLALFVAGDPALAWQPMLAIVGSRAPTAGGRDHARHFAGALAEAGWIIASGLAEGIDAEAHRAALAAARPTVAVIGTGPDISYPRHHRRLQAEITSCGAVLGEYLPGTRARSGHFPARNRLLAALAVGTLVIEAAERSGALITARLAAEAGREAFALPGSIDNPLARGCHRLLREGAGLVESPAELHGLLAPRAARDAAMDARRLVSPGAETPPAGRPTQPSPPRPDFGADPKILWQALGHDPTGMDELVTRTGLTAPVLSAMLLTLELEGRVVSAHGRYQRRGG